MKYENLDKIDIRLLGHLQRDARRPVADIAADVGLSVSACWRRIKILEEAGIITDRVTRLDEEALGLDFVVFAVVSLTIPNRENMALFERQVTIWPEVMDCYTITGAVDYMLRIVTTDIHAYDRFLRDKLLSLGIVGEVQSRIVVTKIKHDTALPLELLAD